jgi:thymidylate synthase
MKYRHEDGTPFTKEEFLEKLRTDKEFNDEFGNKGIDQISDLIKQLKEIPDSRRMLVSAWNPSDLPHQVLPPCHYGFQVYTRELGIEERRRFKMKRDNIARWMMAPSEQMLDNSNVPRRAISLMWNQRSVDTPLGLPFNIASYVLLLMLLAKEVNMIPDELIGNLGDCHIYNNQIEGIQEQLTRETYPLPQAQLDFDYSYSDRYSVECDKIAIEQIKLVDYQSHPAIKMPLSN